MPTGNYDLQINWPSGRHSSTGTITDEQWGEVARILSPDWQAPGHSAQNLNMVSAQPKADPCPKCIPGTVCRTPKCGRLKAQHQPIGIDSEGGSHD